MIRLYLAIVAALMLSPQAFADHRHGSYPTSGPYVGGSLTRNNIDIDFGGGNVEADDTSYRIFGGFALNPYIRLEAGYHDFGDISQAAGRDLDSASVGIEVAAPIGYDMSVFFKAGAHFWDRTFEAGIASVTEEGEDAFYGAGFRYWLGPNFSIVAGYERFELANDDIDVASIGLSFGF